MLSTYAGSGGEGNAAAVAQGQQFLLIHGHELYISDPFGLVRAVDLTTGYEVVVAGAPNVAGVPANGDGGPATSARLLYPEGLAMDAAGNLYIGESYTGAIRRVDTNGTITTFATVGSPNGPIGWVGALAMSPDGYLYASTSAGLVRIDVSGTVSIVSNFRAGDLVIDANGQMYASYVTSPDPQTNTEWVSKVGPSGALTPLLSKPGYSGQYLALDNAGHLLVSSYADAVVQSLDLVSGTVTTVAGDGIAGSTGDGGRAISASLSNPEGVAVDDNGALYFADSGNTRVRRVDYAGTITTFAGTGAVQFSGDGGPAPAAEFSGAGPMAIDGAGNLFMADYGNSRVRKIDPSGIITTYASGIPNALDVALDGAGDLFVVSYASGCDASMIVEITPSGTRSVPVSGQCGIAGVASDPPGNLYYSTHTYPAGVELVQELRTDGTTITVAGGGSGGDGGPATKAQLQQPTGLAVDPAGNLYIAEYSRDTVRKVDTHGIITTVAGTGTIGYSGDGGPGSGAQLQRPLRLTVDSSGNLYIGDTWNYAVRKVDLAGNITTVAGTGKSGLPSDGALATSTSFDSIGGLALDAAGNLYIGDNASIHQVHA